MKRLVTQFDDTRLRATVATPTCSSCCCCCCCLATVVTSSSLLAQRINREAKVHNTSDRLGLTLLAALFVPVVGAITYLLFIISNQVFSRCSSSQLNSNIYYETLSSSCSSPQYVWLLPLSIGSMLFVLWYLYVRVGIQHPIKRSMLIATIVGIAFTAEFFGGAVLILTGIGGVAYLFLVPIVIGWASVWYNKHLREKIATDPVYQAPIKKSKSTIIIICIGLTFAFFGGAMLYTSGVGGVAYLLLVPLIIGMVVVGYNTHLRENATPKLFNRAPVAPDMQHMPAPFMGNAPANSSAPQLPTDDTEPHDS